VLKAARPVLCCLLLAAGPAAAEERGLRLPVRLTAGGSDQLLGELSPDGRHLYFLSDRDTTLEVWAQDLDGGAPRRAFSHDADVTYPRVGPSGKRLLFISFLSDATGDVCVHALEGESPPCLTGSGSAETEAFWFPDGASLGVVTRSGLHADLSLKRFWLSGRRSQTVVARNLASPTVSPDGRWLAYIPIERGSKRVGVTFSQRAARRLEIVRVDRPTDAFELEVDLPGVTGFPAFSKDARWLYFTQYLNDTNFDGAIDGDDHGVLFRVPFSESDPAGASGSIPEQLTSAGRDCRYPTPAKDRLIMTCTSGASLDVFSLPLQGSVPPGWGLSELGAQVAASRNHWEKLLLLGRMASLEPDPDTLRSMALLHTELREYESAAFYARQVERLAKDDPGRAGWATVMLEQIGHRAEERRLIQGQLSRRFVTDQETRLKRLSALADSGPSSVTRAARLVKAEVHDVLGDEGKALEILEGLDLATAEDRFVIRLAGDHPVRLLQALGFEERLLSLLRTLSRHEVLPTLERLRYASRFVATLVVGRPANARQARVEAWREKVEPLGELALLLELESWLTQVGKAPEEKLREGVFDLYRRTTDPVRRKALVSATVRRAADRDQAYLVYEFANSWGSWVKRADPERPYAEALYQQVVLDRAYVERAEDEVSDARGHFFGVTKQTDALEAHVGFIEARYAEGKDDAPAQYARRYKRKPDDPVYLFVQGYLLVRRLPDDPGSAKRALDEAEERLRAAGRLLPRSLEVTLARGYVAQQQFLRTGDDERALEALNYYLLALDLARDNPRWAASVLQGLGVLQAAVGNHRQAVDHLQRRARLPFVDPERALAQRLDEARSLFHSRRSADAARLAETALRAVDEDAGLRRYVPLVLERAALYHYDAGDFARSAALHERRELITAGLDEHGDSRARRLLSWGAAALGADELDEAARRLRESEPLLPADDAGDALRRIRLGLLAEVAARRGASEGAVELLEARRVLLVAHLDDEDLDETLLDLAEARLQLALAAFGAGFRTAARAHVEHGLRRVAEFEERTGSSLVDVGLRLLRTYAELRLYGDVPAGELDLEDLLARAYASLCERNNPKHEPERFLFGLYLTMLGVGGS